MIFPSRFLFELILRGTRGGVPRLTALVASLLPAGEAAAGDSGVPASAAPVASVHWFPQIH